MGCSNIPFERTEREDSVLQRKLSVVMAFVWRCADMALAVLALIVLSPLLIVVSLAVWATSGRPILFRQTRAGLNGKTFVLYKFRSMKNGSWQKSHSELISRQTQEPLSRRRYRQTFDGKDRRAIHQKPIPVAQLTPLGRFLRATSLDELPQFWNVLRGDMSLVGPRPLSPYELTSLQPWHMARFSVKPGLSGLWQVSGRSQLNYAEMLNLDVEYVRRKSLGLNLLILIKTPRALLFPG